MVILPLLLKQGILKVSFAYSWLCMSILTLASVSKSLIRDWLTKVMPVWDKPFLFSKCS